MLPLDFHSRVRVVRSMCLPAALHGVESSLLALDSLRKLRSSICRPCLAFWMGLLGVILLFVQSGLGFDSFVVILLYGPLRLVVLIVFWRWSVRVALVMVPSIFSLLVLLRLAFGGILLPWLGLGLVCPCLVI